MFNVRPLALCCALAIVSFAAGATAVVAQDFFESLFGNASNYSPRPYDRGYAPAQGWRDYAWSRRARQSARRLAKQRRLHGERGGAPSLAYEQSSGPRYVCLRTCDGYTFPHPDTLSGSSARSRQAACHSFCPGAETKVQHAKNSEMASIAREETSAQPRSRARGDCVCNKPSTDEERVRALFADYTLQKGDTIMTLQGWRVFRGASHFPYNIHDFAPLSKLRRLGRQAQSQFAAIERAKPAINESVRRSP